MHARFSLAVAFSIISFSAYAQTTPAIDKALASVKGDDVRARMTFLADDLVEGRKPGTRGFLLASKYVQTQFIAMGVTPGAEDGTYVQPVPLRNGIVEEAGSSFTLITKDRKEALAIGQDLLIAPNFANKESSVTAPLLFVGYGISAPELGYNDYAKVDAKGKIVVMLTGAPASFPNNERAHFGSAGKFTEAIARGAVGVIMFSMPTGSRTGWEATVKRAKAGAYKWVEKNGAPGNAYDELKAVAVFNPDNAAALFAASGKTIQSVSDNAKASKPQAFDLRMSAEIKVKTSYTDTQSSNLIGVIEGSDPVLKNEYIVYTAHLDHFGKGAPVKGDSLFNGAHDNASGTSILLGIAQTFKALPTAPKRSILFTVVTGEELGLLGSDYFVNHPTVDINSIVANLSVDMPFFFHPILDIVPYGVQHSSLSKQVDQATSILNLKVSPDPQPEQVIFVRSDHYSFIKKGIPALFIKSGFMTVPSDTVNRAKSDVRWRSTTYHTPQDDMTQAFDFTAAAMHVKVNFLIGYLAAEDRARPNWNQGDFFGGKFGKK